MKWCTTHQWCSIEEVSYCSYVKFQGHTSKQIFEFDPNWAFPDYNSSLNSPMAMKWCTPASRGMLDRRWANIVTYVGAMSANEVGPTWICPSVQRWHNVVTPPTMTLCQRFANVINYCILLYLMVGTTFAPFLFLLTCLNWARTGPMPVASAKF